MTSRRTGVITALLLTAALFLAMPGLVGSVLGAPRSRVHESLRPKPAQTLTVWLLPGKTDDRRLIARAASAFEKEHPGVRVFLRVVTAEEFTAPEAVLPDVALYETGSLNLPQKLFVPLAGEAESSGMFAGSCYAVPLWLSPNVLSLPASWLSSAAIPTPKAASLLASATPEPAAETQSQLSAETLPWNRLIQPGAIQQAEGAALCQLLSMCPYPMRKAFSAAAPAEAGAESARVQPLAKHLQSVQNGETLVGCVLTPAVSDRVRYLSLCRDHEAARAFAQFLRTQIHADLLACGLIPLTNPPPAAPDALTQQALDLFAHSHTLPNAFAHTREELFSLCRDAFLRCADPVETLLRLR